MEFKFNVGDIVEYMYSPGVELTVIEVRPLFPSYLLSNGLTIFESQIKLIEAYQPEDRNNTPLIIIACVVVYLFIKG